MGNNLSSIKDSRILLVFLRIQIECTYDNNNVIWNINLSKDVRIRYI